MQILSCYGCYLGLGSLGRFNGLGDFGFFSGGVVDGLWCFGGLGFQLTRVVVFQWIRRFGVFQ